MSIYQSDPDAAPDSEFEPGTLHHLVAGNTGRLLDARRTPVTVTEVRIPTGTFCVRIEAFEDAGAVWESPMENAHHYQFALGSRTAASDAVDAYRAAVERFDRPLEVPCDLAVRRRTDTRLAGETRRAADWLRGHSRFLAGKGTLPPPQARRGDERLFADLGAYMQSRGVGDLESAFAEQFVSNPTSGDLVPAHRIVIAEMGLVPYAGKVLRDPGALAGAWSRERRADHIAARIGFVRALAEVLGLEEVVLYRGISTEKTLEPPGNHTFVSATFSIDVARSHFTSGTTDATTVLYRQAVPVDRLFMTYHETEAMNRQFLEAEAVLFFDPGNRIF
jgi:hypothetical protein